MTPDGFKMVILDSLQPIKMKIFGFLLSMLNISMVVSGKNLNTLLFKLVAVESVESIWNRSQGSEDQNQSGLVRG